MYCQSEAIGVCDVFAIQSVVSICPDDVTEWRRDAAVSSRSPENSTAHTATLLRLQGHLGLDYPVSHLLHGNNGPIQRGLQEQNQRGRVASRGRQYRRCHLLHRYRIEFPHNLRRGRWRSRLRSEGSFHFFFILINKIK